MTAVDARIDPLRPCPDARYEDHLVLVERGGAGGPGGPGGLSARALPDGRIAVTHNVSAADLDDEIGSMLAPALAALTDDHGVFARAFTGLVLTSASGPVEAWTRFYRNTLARITHPTEPGYSEVYRHALELLPRTSVVDLGASFGFLAIHLADRGVSVTACDVDAGTTNLLRLMARRLHADLDVVRADGTNVPLRSQSADAVALLHVLEHVDAADGAALLTEAMRIARHRVVVAVPFEQRPTALFGHVRVFGPDDLRDIALASGWEYEIHAHHGGWLVLDRCPLRSDRPPWVTAPSEGEPQ